MEKLFSYGTLQLESVQLETFGRKLTGSSDVLPKYKISEVKILDQEVVKKSGREMHPILIHSGSETDEVKGIVFEVSEEELKFADQYEVNDYIRIKESLKSGVKAWAYVHSDRLTKISSTAVQ